VVGHFRNKGVHLGFYLRYFIFMKSIWAQLFSAFCLALFAQQVLGSSGMRKELFPNEKHVENALGKKHVEKCTWKVHFENSPIFHRDNFKTLRE